MKVDSIYIERKGGSSIFQNTPLQFKVPIVIQQHSKTFIWHRGRYINDMNATEFVSYEHGLSSQCSMENSQPAHLDPFVLLSLPLLMHFSACTRIWRWALGQESPVFPSGQHSNKPISFSPAPVSMSLAFIAAGSQTCVW